MNKKERKILEMGIRNVISYKEEKLRRIATEAGIEEVKVMIGILEDAVKSQDSEILIRGLNYYQVIQTTMAVLEIEHDKIDSSEEKLMSLANEIFERLPTEIKLAIIARMEDEEPVTRIFVNDPTYN